MHRAWSPLGHEARYTFGYQSGLDKYHEARYILCDISLGVIRNFRGHLFLQKGTKKEVWFRLGVFAGLPQGSVLERGLRGRRAGTDRFQRVRRLPGTRTKAPVSLFLFIVEGHTA